ncbi:hypothetical protein EZV62_027280 [Acer yangbiense]|uniref:CCHC-type domain-containing protein n=1 Tax=Acer yangbiense TaxID=1000413 RepID=A0A5C7GV57_9ROSI|nr:hypothetical protein EZV62_027280 [Acer yangbiense]
MDQEEIVRLCASLSLKSKEETLWSIRDTLKDSAGRKLDLCLVGKVLTNKHINREAFRTVMPKVWQTTLGVEVVQDNTFLFYFHNQGDRFRIFSGGPWSFDNSLLVLEKPLGLGDVASLAFNRVDFWIQIPNALLLCMTKEMGEFIGQLIGNLKDIDVGSTGEYFGKYMRLKMEVDVSKPLKRFLRLELEKGKESILLLRYEKLPEYCFHCGIVGHSYQKCGQRRDVDIGVTKEFEFGAWMRASDPSGRNNSAGLYRYRGDGVKTNTSGARAHNGGQNRSVVAGVCNGQVSKEGVIVGQGDKGAEVLNAGVSYMQVVNVVTQNNVENSEGVHVGINNVERGLGGQSHGEGETPLRDVTRNVDESEGRKKKGKWKRWARKGGVRGEGSDIGFRPEKRGQVRSLI